MSYLDDMAIVGFELVGNYTIKIIFKDGKAKTINFESVIGEGWMAQLLDLEYFRKVELNDGGNLEWPDGQDFNPEALYNWERFEKIYIEDAKKKG